MLIACWSVKGGVGTSVVAAAVSLALARHHPAGCVLADLAGDQPAVLGLAEPGGPGLVGWASTWPDVPPEGLGRLEVPVVEGLALLPAGAAGAPPTAGALRALGEALLVAPRPAVVDVGVLRGPDPVGRSLLDVATRSLLVVRPCYLALRRAVEAPARPTGVVVVDEGDRALRADDVARAVDAPVVAVVPAEPSVARAVDAGVLARRVPRRLARSLAGVA